MLVLKRTIKFALERFGIYVSRKPIISSEEYIMRLEDELIRGSTGVIHIGAHYGQEGQRYSNLGVKVLWVEAIPKVYEQLVLNISVFSNQVAFCALLGDKNDEIIEFNLSSNALASSSIFKFGKELGFDQLQMQHQMSIVMHRLDSLFENEYIAG